MRILITGSSGMLGQALCNMLAGEHDVVGIDIEERTEGRSQKINFFKIDITDKELTTQKIKELNPNIIIHSAAYTDVDGCEKDVKRAHRLNVEATENVALVTKQCGSFLIYISTDFIFDGKKNSPYTEEDIPGSISIYGKTKFEGEIAVKKALDRYLIIRTSWLFGKGGKNFVEAIIKQARHAGELKVVNDQRGNPTYSNDLAQAIGFIIKGQRTEVRRQEILNITNSGSCSWYEYAEEIINLTEIKNVKVVPITSQELNRLAKRPAMSVLDNAKFNKIYGKNLPHWKDALKRYLKERIEN